MQRSTGNVPARSGGPLCPAGSCATRQRASSIMHGRSTRFRPFNSPAQRPGCCTGSRSRRHNKGDTAPLSASFFPKRTAPSHRATSSICPRWMTNLPPRSSPRPSSRVKIPVHCSLIDSTAHLCLSWLESFRSTPSILQPYFLNLIIPFFQLHGKGTLSFFPRPFPPKTKQSRAPPMGARLCCRLWGFYRGQIRTSGRSSSGSGPLRRVWRWLWGPGRCPCR